MQYPADPPTVAEVIAVTSAAADIRLRTVILVLPRAVLRISEALALTRIVQ
jgi:hypothetical protein